MSLTAIPNAAGQMVYRFRGRFISKSRYDELSQYNSYLTGQLGAAPSGFNWVQIAAKYTERFEDYIGDLNTL